MAQAVLKPMGPCFDMTVRRTQWAPIELAKQALRRPKSAHYKPKSVKCVHNPLREICWLVLLDLLRVLVLALVLVLTLVLLVPLLVPPA